MRRFGLHPGAEREAEEAARHYAGQSPETAQSFVSALERSIRLVIEFPNTWPRVSESVRRRPIEGFPYWIVYQMRDESLRILAIVHESRRPGYWKERVKDDS